MSPCVHPRREKRGRNLKVHLAPPSRSISSFIFLETFPLAGIKDR